VSASRHQPDLAVLLASDRRTRENPCHPGRLLPATPYGENIYQAKYGPWFLSAATRASRLEYLKNNAPIRCSEGSRRMSEKAR